MSKRDEHDSAAAHDRSELGFARIVEGSFSFLVDDFGFDLVESDVTYVRYESDDVFLNVYHGRASYEIDVEVGRRDEGDAGRYRLREVLGVLEPEHGQASTHYLQASSLEGVRRCVETAADLVRRHYAPLLTCDADAFDRVERFTAMLNEDYTREVVQQPVRDAAEEAWQARDYAEVVNLYRSIKQDLTQMERKRLEYAEKHFEG